MSGSIIQAKNPSNTYQPLTVDSSGRLECSVNEIELTADSINVNLEDLEALQTSANSKLDNVVTNTTGLNNCVSGNELQVDVVSGSITATVSGVSTEAKQDSQITLLGAGLPSTLQTDQLKVIDSGTQLGLTAINNNALSISATNASLDTKATTRDGHLNNIENNTTGLATETTVGDIDTKLGNRLPPALTGSGNLKVSIEESNAGDATLSEQQSQTALLTTMDTDTGNIASNTSLSNSLLTSVDNKITKGENDISAGTGCQQVLIMGKDAFSPFNLEPIRMSSDKVLVESQISNVSSGIVNSLPVSDSKITQGYDSQVPSGGSGLQQNLCYGRDNSGNLDALRTDAQGHLEVTIDDFHKGQGTHSDSFPITSARDKVSDTVFMTTELIGANSFGSSVLDTGGANTVLLYGEQTGGTFVSNNTLKVLGSNSATGTFYHIGNLAVSNYNSKNYLNEGTPLLYNANPRFVKIFNTNGSSVTITLRAVLSNFLEYQ